MQQASQGEQSPALSAGKKRILILVTTLIGIFLLAYTALFVYYTWQFKYGDPEDVKRITTQIEKSNFTLADSSKTQRQTAIKTGVE